MATAPTSPTVASGVGPISFIYNLITEGVAPTAGLKAYREAGGMIRTQRFFQAYGEVAAAVGRRPVVEAAPATSVPSADEISRRASAARPGYLYRVGVINTQRGIVTERGAMAEETVLDWVAVRSEHLLQYAEAMALAEETISTGYRSESGLVTLQGSFVSEVNEFYRLGPDE